MRTALKSADYRGGLRFVALGVAVGLWIGTPAAAQAPQAPLFGGMNGPCGDRICPAPTDPLTRNGFVLRLSSPFGVLETTALVHGVGFSGLMGPGALAQSQQRASEIAAKSPTARLSAGAGEAFSGRFAAAQTLLQQAVTLSTADGDSMAEAASLSNLGVVAAMQGRYDEARTQMLRALDGFARTPTKRLAVPGAAPQVRALANWGAFVVELNLASLAAHLARYDEAEARFIKAAERGKTDDEFGSVRMALGELAQLYRKTAQVTKAAEYRRLALAAPPVEDADRLSLMVSEIALNGTALDTHASAPPEPEKPPPGSTLPPAALLLKKQFEDMARAAGQAEMARVMPSFIACDNGTCAKPGDPATRRDYILRLAGVPASMLAALQGVGKGSEALGSRARGNALGIRSALEGRIDVARAEWMKVLEESTGGRDATAEAAALSNLGVAAAMQGRIDEARSRLESAHAAYGKLDAARAPGREAMAKSGSVPAFAAMRPGDLGALLEAAMGGAGEGSLLVALNLANLEAKLGRQAEADKWLKRGLEQAMRGGHGSRLVLSEMAVIERLRGRPDAAADAAHRARQGDDPAEAWRQVEQGFLVLGTPVQRTPPPVAAAAANDASEAAVRDSASEAVHARLALAAAERERAGDTAGAIAAQMQAALHAAADGNAERERPALASLQRLYLARGEAEAAILFGKRSVNLIQSLRRSLEQLDRASRQAFLAEKKPSYVLLAQALLDRGRLAEAEHVLRLLKEDEGQQFQDAVRSRSTVPYTAQESAAILAYERLAERLRPLNTQRARMAGGPAIDGPLDSRAAIESARLLNLSRTDLTLATLELSVTDSTGDLARCRTLAAKISSAPTAADKAAVADCVLSQRGLALAVKDGAVSAQALKRDAARFVTPPTAIQARQIDAVLSRFAVIQAKVVAALGPASQQFPVSPAQQQAAASMVSMMLDTGRLHELWAVQLEMDELAHSFVAQQAGLNSTLVTRGEPMFSAADAALIETGTRLMKSLPTGTAAIYYLGGEQRLDILLVTAQGRSKARAEVGRDALAQRIKAFQQALNNPSLDAVPPARDLYALLIEPIDGALKAARATTLMIALEGPLRYVPFAALHDGKGWLAERYAASLYTTAVPNALTAEPAPAWQAVAFGSTQGGAGLSPLFSVKGELQAIVSDPSQRSQGVMPGQIRLDRDFTALALRESLRKRPNVIHIASHFVFQAQDAGTSFLLLGDGSQLTLTQLAAPAYRFDQVDLVTLSACETAVVAGNSFGQEVEALGTLLQAQGAAAVLSTLWSVADASTAQFMRRFYEAREAKPSGRGHLSRAAALRMAQLSFIRADAALSPPMASEDRRGAARAGDPPTLRDTTRPYAHPYYWAPFVLMGNWL